MKITTTAQAAFERCFAWGDREAFGHSLGALAFAGAISYFVSAILLAIAVKHGMLHLWAPVHVTVLHQGPAAGTGISIDCTYGGCAR